MKGKTTMKGFTHLHLHTKYSLLTSTIEPTDLFDYCKELGMDSVAITDNGNLSGVAKFYQSAVAAGIKPIIGIETSFAYSDKIVKSQSPMPSYKLVLLAENNIGYSNLLELSSNLFIRGNRPSPISDLEMLKEFSEGLICLSGGSKGVIEQLMGYIFMRYICIDEVIEYVKILSNIFGNNNFFLEIQKFQFNRPDSSQYFINDVAKFAGIGTVITNDVRFLQKKDSQTYRLLSYLDDSAESNRPFEFNNNNYLKSPEQMRHIFPEFSQAADATLEIAARCNVDIDFSNRHYPAFACRQTLSSTEIIRRLCIKGARRLYPELTQKIIDRLQYELEIIERKKLTPLFLELHDVCKQAKYKSIQLSIRGSAAGSLACYCLGLSNPDPIKYGLMFERFMDASADNIPDFAFDVSEDGQRSVIESLQINGFEAAKSKILKNAKAKWLIKRLGAVFGLSKDETNAVCNLTSNGLRFNLQSELEGNSQLRDAYNKNPAVKRLLIEVDKMKNIPKRYQTHISADITTEKPLIDLDPLCISQDNNELIINFDIFDTKKLGLMQFNLMVFSTLSTIEKALEFIYQFKDTEIDITDIDNTDKKVFSDVFACGNTEGILMFDSENVIEITKRLNPSTIEDLATIFTLCYSGNIEQAETLISRKQGSKWQSPHPILREIVLPTHGIILYIEQVMDILHRLGGIELHTASKIVGNIAKIKRYEITEARRKFINGCENNQILPTTANEIFDMIEAATPHTFLKAHAINHALIAYRAAYLKTYWLKQFKLETGIELMNVTVIP